MNKISSSIASPDLGVYFPGVSARRRGGEGAWRFTAYQPRGGSLRKAPLAYPGADHTPHPAPQEGKTLFRRGDGDGWFWCGWDGDWEGAVIWRQVTEVWSWMEEWCDAPSQALLTLRVAPHTRRAPPPIRFGPRRSRHSNPIFQPRPPWPGTH